MYFIDVITLMFRCLKIPVFGTTLPLTFTFQRAAYSNAFNPAIHWSSLIITADHVTCPLDTDGLVFKSVRAGLVITSASERPEFSLGKFMLGLTNSLRNRFREINIK